MARKPAIKCPVEHYARAVVAGEIVAGRLVRLACERHLRDMTNGPTRGLWWDAQGAEKAIQFFAFLRLPCEGELDGKPFELQPFQQFIIGNLFGWKNASDKTRRFRTAFIEQGKGNGKTPLAAGVGLIGLVADGEAGAEIYPAATTREQAGILFRDAKRMVESSPALRTRLEINQHNIAYHGTDSFLRPVSSEHRGLDGKRPHMALLDEIHEHPTAMVVDKMRAGTKGRRQALIFEITNSGYDKNSVCWHHHDYSAKVLEGVLENDAWFAYVCQLDPCEPCRREGKIQPDESCKECDDWRDEKVWPKANPGLDTVLPSKYLREQVREADGMPSKEGIVKRLNFCIWTEVAVRAIPMDRWDACPDGLDPDNFERAECYGGLDLSITTDLSAFVLLFPTSGGYAVLPHFWAPAEGARKRESRDRVPYETWARQGLLKLTSGDVIDYDVIRSDINELSKRYRIREIAADRWNASQILTQLAGDGLEIIAYGQGYKDMTAPTKELLKLIVGGQLLHGGNPILRWMASNLATESDAAGNLKPSKKKSTERIDGLVALIMALGRAMVRGDGENWYTPGIVSGHTPDLAWE